jgi:hypothetical protein
MYSPKGLLGMVAVRQVVVIKSSVTERSALAMSE